MAETGGKCPLVFSVNPVDCSKELKKIEFQREYFDMMIFQFSAAKVTLKLTLFVSENWYTFCIPSVNLCLPELDSEVLRVVDFISR